MRGPLSCETNQEQDTHTKTSIEARKSGLRPVKVSQITFASKLEVQAQVCNRERETTSHWIREGFHTSFLYLSPRIRFTAFKSFPNPIGIKI